MTDHDGRTRWYTADPRGILPLEGFKVSKSLAQRYRSPRFQVRVNTAFEATMRGCMHRPGEGTWISEDLIRAYLHLHELGHAHSVETWRNEQLVGGLYGVSLRGAFFGESMFHRETDASKVALVALVERLRSRGFSLLDAQATTSHLKAFGAIDVPANEYLALLREALKKECTFA
jgi:leucyl/phenylalanyl-tRNA--protein transferase